MKCGLMSSDVNTVMLLQASQIKLAGVESRLMESYKWNNNCIKLEASPQDKRLSHFTPVPKILIIKPKRNTKLCERYYCSSQQVQYVIQTPYLQEKNRRDDLERGQILPVIIF